MNGRAVGGAGVRVGRRGTWTGVWRPPREGDLDRFGVESPSSEEGLDNCSSSGCGAPGPEPIVKCSGPLCEPDGPEPEVTLRDKPRPERKRELPKVSTTVPSSPDIAESVINLPVLGSHNRQYG